MGTILLFWRYSEEEVNTKNFIWLLKKTELEHLMILKINIFSLSHMTWKADYSV